MTTGKSLLEIEKINPLDFVIYEKIIDNFIYSIQGLQTNNGNGNGNGNGNDKGNDNSNGNDNANDNREIMIHRACGGINQFEKELSVIPHDYSKTNDITNLNLDWLHRYFINTSLELLEKDNLYYKGIKEQHGNDKYYFTHWNGGRPYLVYISSNNLVSIYKFPKNKYYFLDADYERDPYKNYKNIWMFINLVGQYQAKNIWIANSYNTDHLGTHNTNLDIWEDDFCLGNTILLQIDNNNANANANANTDANTDRYVFIEGEIYEFTMENDTVDKYYSPIGGNDVPYSSIIGKNNIYFLQNKEFLPKTAFGSSLSLKDEIHIYGLYYDLENIEDNKIKTLKNVKLIDKNNCY